VGDVANVMSLGETERLESREEPWCEKFRRGTSRMESWTRCCRIRRDLRKGGGRWVVRYCGSKPEDEGLQRGVCRTLALNKYLPS